MPLRVRVFSIPRRISLWLSAMDAPPAQPPAISFAQGCGGQFDTRFQAYFGDTWKVKPNFTLSLGIRYNRDTGRTDSDLPAIQALNDFQAGLGNPVNQPNKNIGGTIGIAWDPWKNGKTAIRAGA